MPIFPLRLLATNESHSYASTQITLPLSTEAIAKALIAEEDLFTEEADCGVETESHVTVLYGLDDSALLMVSALVKGFGSLRLKFARTGVFQPEGKDYDVVYIDVESPDLKSLHNLLLQLPHKQSDFDYYEPHLTLAYVRRSTGVRYQGLAIPGVNNYILDVSSIQFSATDHTIFDIPL